MKKINLIIIIILFCNSILSQVTISKIELKENENFILGTDVSVSQEITIDTLILKSNSVLGISKNINKLKIISNYVVIDNATISANWERKGKNGNAFSSAARNGGKGHSGVNGSKGANGTKGGNGIRIILDFDIVSISELNIYNKGGNGGNGARGQNGGNGGRAWCKGNRKGGNGGNGGNGGDGGQGGNGGDVTVYFKFIDKKFTEDVIILNLPVSIENSGGNGGDGGDGGNAGLGGPSHKCGVWPARWTKGGGKNGINGQKGKNGQIGNSGKKETFFGDSPN